MSQIKTRAAFLLEINKIHLNCFSIAFFMLFYSNLTNKKYAAVLNLPSLFLSGHLVQADRSKMTAVNENSVKVSESDDEEDKVQLMKGETTASSFLS